MSDTPRTDAEANDGWSGDAVCVSADFARQLECELSQSQSDLKHMADIAEAMTKERDEWESAAQKLKESASALEWEMVKKDRDIAELQKRLCERTAAYEAKDAKQVLRIQELEREIERLRGATKDCGWVCKCCGVSRPSNWLVYRVRHEKDQPWIDPACAICARSMCSEGPFAPPITNKHKP